MKIRIAQFRAYPVKGDLQANHSRLMGVLDEVSTHKPDVVITPECYLDGYMSTETETTRENIVEYAIDPEKSPYATDISEWASNNNSWVIYGCSRATPNGAYNTALIFDRKGDLVGTYDKTHCQNTDKKYMEGQSLPVFQSEFGTFGVMICADRRWPETVRTLAMKGARVIFNPTYGMHDERNLHMMQTRSYESEVFIAFTHPGQSLLTGPAGDVKCNEISTESEFTICEADLEEVEKIRSSETSHLKDRKDAIYEL
jgi:predicted amidohydrolase